MTKIEIAIKFCKYYFINKTQLNIKNIYFFYYVGHGLINLLLDQTRSGRNHTPLFMFTVKLNSTMNVQWRVKWRVSLSTECIIRKFVESSWELLSADLYFFVKYIWILKCVLENQIGCACFWLQKQTQPLKQTASFPHFGIP